MHNSSRPTILIFFIVALLFTVVVGLTIANYRYSEQNPGGNDFLARWMGARYWLVYGVSPYDPSVSLASQRAIYGRPADPERDEDKAHFVYPLNSMIFFGVFGLMEYVPARALWMTLVEICLVGFTFISIKLSGWKVPVWKSGFLVLFSLAWYHGARNIFLGQFAGINAFMIAVGLLLLIRKQDYGAGIIFSLTTAKPQMVFLIIPLTLIWTASNRRWEHWWGLATGLLVQIGISLLLLPGWPIQMIYQMLDYPSYTTMTASPLSMIAGAAPGIYERLNIGLHAIFIIYLLIEWYLVLKKDERHFLWTAFVTCVITNLVAYRTATTNYAILLVAFFYIFRVIEERWKLIGHLFTWLSLAGLFVGLWWIFITTVQGNQEQAIMYLPVPILTLAGLWWVRWWATHPLKLPLETYRNRYT